MSEDGERLVRTSRHPLLLAAGAGALWGTVSFLVLWGHTPLTVTRRFVVGVVGTLALLPVRIVLWGIRTVERATGRSYHFPDTNWWIGVVAALVGAALVAGLTLVARALLKRARA